MYKKILVAVDGSRTSYSDLKEALKLVDGENNVAEANNCHADLLVREQ